MKKHRGNFQADSQVHGFQRGSDVDRAVTEVGDRDGIAAAVPVGPRRTPLRAGRRRRRSRWSRSAPASLHCRCIEPPRPRQKPRDRPQISARLRSITVRMSSPKSDGGVDAVGSDVVECLGQELVVPAVGSIDGIVGGQQRAPNRRRRPPVRWTSAAGPWMSPWPATSRTYSWERTDQDQLAEHGLQQLRFGGIPIFDRGRDLHPGAAGCSGVCVLTRISPKSRLRRSSHHRRNGSNPERSCGLSSLISGGSVIIGAILGTPVTWCVVPRITSRVASDAGVGGAVV